MGPFQRARQWSAAICPISGNCSTCWGMYGSGAWIHMESTLIRLLIQKGRMVLRPVFFVEAVGLAIQPDAVQLLASTALRTISSFVWVFGWPYPRAGEARTGDFKAGNVGFTAQQQGRRTIGVEPGAGLRVKYRGKVFHTVEYIFPLCGKIAKKFSIAWKKRADFSIVWKTFFHSVEKPEDKAT